MGQRCPIGSGVPSNNRRNNMAQMKSHKWRMQAPVVKVATLVGTAVALVAAAGAPSKWW